MSAPAVSHETVAQLEILYPADLEEHGFGVPNPWFYVIVAEKGDQLIGYLLWYRTYSTWTGKSAYMEDFYVTPAFRGLGIGQAMLSACAKVRHAKLSF